MKVVINGCFGGFELSYKGVMEYAKRKGITLYAFTDKRDELGNINFRLKNNYVQVNEEDKNAFLLHYSTKPLIDGAYEEGSYFSERDIDRADPALIETVEALGDDVNGRCAKLKVIEIPDGVRWEIDDYDGNESIHEVHSSWS